jgi:hypothetical protein
MKFTPLSIYTLIPQIPKIHNDNFTSFKRYLDIFYDEELGVIVSPVDTTGRVRAATGQFVNVITDNLTVKKQFTNLYENYTTIDSDFLTSFNGEDVSTRIAAVDASGFSTWPLEPSAYVWVDVQTPYIKINNDASYGFQNDKLGLEFRILFNLDVSTTSNYVILIDSSEGGQQNLVVTAADASATWIKLITTNYDVSYGPTWTVKEYGGTYTLS